VLPSIDPIFGSGIPQARIATQHSTRLFGSAFCRPDPHCLTLCDPFATYRRLSHSPASTICRCITVGSDSHRPRALARAHLRRCRAHAALLAVTRGPVSTTSQPGQSWVEQWAAGAGAAIGAIVGGATGAAIAAQGQPRPGGYRYYQQGCYQQRGDGAWVVVAPEYCAPAAAPAVEVAPPPPRGRIVRDELQDRMLELRERCEDGDRRACVRLGILIGENRERRAAWRREHPEVVFYER
jgi:hypothetical protein